MAVKEKITKKTGQKKGAFQQMTDKELAVNLADFKKELQETRFKTITSGFTNVSRFKILKRNIARILTIQKLRSKQAVESK